MANSKQAFSTVSIKPLVGTLDTRSFPSDVALGAWRYKLNFQLRDGTKLCTRPGFEKLFSGVANYKNQDFHDKGSVAIPAPASEYPTFLFEATTNVGQRYLYGGTQSQLAYLDEYAGLWNQIATGKGGTHVAGLAQTRFKAAELSEQMVFTNNVDPVLYHTVGNPAPAANIASLLALPVTAAAVVAEFAGFMLVMNVVEDGTRVSSRIWWSDYLKPQDFGVFIGSLSNYQDLDYGDQILAAVPMAGALYIFTSRAIWRCTPTGDGTVFAFAKVYYEPLNQAKCLLYPNTLVSTGTSCWYASAEAFYYFDPYVPEPVRHEWLFRGGAIMFSNQSALSPACCQSPVAQAHPTDQEIWVSWPEISTDTGACINSKTLVFNYTYQSCDIVDFGFSQFANYRPSTPDNAVCKSSSQLFIGASSSDQSLKQIGGVFSRESLDNVGVSGSVVNGIFVPFVGIYSHVGYFRVLRMVLPLVNYDRNKIIRQILLEYHSTVETNRNVVRLRVGNSFSEADPNLPDDKCSVLWHRMEDKPLVCLDAKLPSEYVSENLVRNEGMQWPMYVKGRFLYVEFTVASNDGSPAIGADSCCSRIEVETQLCDT